MRLRVVRGLRRGARCLRRWRCGTVARGVQLRHRHGHRHAPLASREATCAILTSYHGNFPSLDVEPVACHWPKDGESSQRRLSIGRAPTRTPHTSRKRHVSGASSTPWYPGFTPPTPRAPPKTPNELARPPLSAPACCTLARSNGEGRGERPLSRWSLALSQHSAGSHPPRQAKGKSRGNQLKGP
jgi:hypothetical protein